MSTALEIVQRNWCGLKDPVDIHLYVLALDNGHFYVGLTADMERRFGQHSGGRGAEWTKLHTPVRILHRVNTGTRDTKLAEQYEDEVTVALMLKHGIDKVRGGHFCERDLLGVEGALQARGHWSRIKQAQIQHLPVNAEDNWNDALETFLERALSFYDNGSPASEQSAMFAAIYALTRYRYWREDFAPALEWSFWGKPGVLPVLLSFKYGRAVGSRSESAYHVLQAASLRTKKNARRFMPLYVLVWQTYVSKIEGLTDNQLDTASEYARFLSDGHERDRCYDAFVSVLLPESRSLLRANPQ